MRCQSVELDRGASCEWRPEALFQLISYCRLKTKLLEMAGAASSKKMLICKSCLFCVLCCMLLEPVIMQLCRHRVSWLAIFLFFSKWWHDVQHRHSHALGQSACLYFKTWGLWGNFSNWCDCKTLNTLVFWRDGLTGKEKSCSWEKCFSTTLGSNS